jgi:hypothetical protein
MTDAIGAGLAAAGIALNVYWIWMPKRPAPGQEEIERHVEAPEHAPIEPTDLIETPAKEASRGKL